jgi:hypothetical protein
VVVVEIPAGKKNDKSKKKERKKERQTRRVNKLRLMPRLP